MRIRYLSDLHLEFTEYCPSEVPSIGEDVVILAGDIGVGLKGVQWASRALAGRQVIYVLGNHEYYNHHFIDLPYKMRALARGSNVHVLENESLVIGGIRFLGSTFWTNFNLFGRERQFECMQLAENSMTDYRLILTGPLGALRRIKPEDTLERHIESRSWLRGEISTSREPCVVVTHYGPSYKVCVGEYQNELLTAAFLNNADDLFCPPVKAWIYGHTHQVLRHEINGIPVLSNQLGYSGHEVPGFSWDTCIEIN